MYTASVDSDFTKKLTKTIKKWRFIMKFKKNGILFTALAALALSATVCLSACSARKSNHLIEGGWYHAYPMGGHPVDLKLENGEFCFSDPASSTLTRYEDSCHGVYSISGDILELQCADSEDKFVFTISDNKLYLDRDKSSSLNLMLPYYDLELQFTGEEVCFSLYGEDS